MPYKNWLFLFSCILTIFASCQKSVQYVVDEVKGDYLVHRLATYIDPINYDIDTLEDYTYTMIIEKETTNSVKITNMGGCSYTTYGDISNGIIQYQNIEHCTPVSYSTKIGYGFITIFDEELSYRYSINENLQEHDSTATNQYVGINYQFVANKIN